MSKIKLCTSQIVNLITLLKNASNFEDGNSLIAIDTEVNVESLSKVDQLKRVINNMCFDGRINKDAFIMMLNEHTNWCSTYCIIPFGHCDEPIEFFELEHDAIGWSSDYNDSIAKTYYGDDKDSYAVDPDAVKWVVYSVSEAFTEERFSVHKYGSTPYLYEKRLNDAINKEQEHLNLLVADSDFWGSEVDVTLSNEIVVDISMLVGFSIAEDDEWCRSIEKATPEEICKYNLSRLEKLKKETIPFQG